MLDRVTKHEPLDAAKLSTELQFHLARDRRLREQDARQHQHLAHRKEVIILSFIGLALGYLLGFISFSN